MMITSRVGARDDCVEPHETRESWWLTIIIIIIYSSAVYHTLSLQIVKN